MDLTKFEDDEPEEGPIKQKRLHHFRFPVENPKALVFLIHGSDDYASRYAFLGQVLSKTF